jgi:DNA-binding transcriptional regulator YiaG
VKTTEKVVKKVAPAPAPKEAKEERKKPGRKVIFTAEAFAAQRAALGITQAQMAQLLGASPLSVYKWESGKVQPRAAQLERILGMRKLGKREAAARLAATDTANAAE